MGVQIEKIPTTRIGSVEMGGLMDDRRTAGDIDVAVGLAVIQVVAI